jgi:hypothetical membrane protein
MGVVTPNQLRTGALAWLLTLQFFVVETVAEARMTAPYSRTANTISVLGATDSPAHRLMNGSFVVQAVLIVVGAVLLRPALRGASARVAQAVLGVAAAGVLIVGFFPRNTHSLVHAVGAVAYLVGAGLGLIALAYAVRPRSEALGTGLALLGLIGTAMTVFFLTGVTGYLGLGGTERAAGYVLPIGLAVAGAALWWMGEGTDGGSDAGTPREARGLAREQERARRAEQQRARDEALESAARRGEPEGASIGAGPVDADGEDDADPEDPWATPTRRRD